MVIVEYLTHLFVTNSNFTARFTNLSYHGIKHLFDKHEVNYSWFKIKQVLELKIKLEQLNFCYNFNTIMSFDTINI